MATSKSSFRLEIKGFDPPPAGSDYTQGITCNITLDKPNITDGTADNQIKRIACEAVTIPASGTHTIDMQSADRYGEPHAATDAALVYISNSGPGTVEIRPGAATAWSNLLGAGSALKLAANTGFMVHAFGAGDLAVAAGNKNLDIVETSGVDTADVTISYWTRN